MKRKLKWLTALIFPPILLVIITFALSFIGVYIENDSFLLLKGGYENAYISLGVFLFANLFLWIIMFIIKPYRKVLHQGKWSAIFVALEIFLLLIAVFAYYLFIHFLLTNVYLWDITISLSDATQTQLFTNIALIASIVIMPALIANITLYKLSTDIKSHDEIKSTDKPETTDNKTQDSGSSGGFENMIAD